MTDVLAACTDHWRAAEPPTGAYLRMIAMRASHRDYETHEGRLVAEVLKLQGEVEMQHAEVARLRRKCGELCADGQGGHAYATRTIRVCVHCGALTEGGVDD